MGGPEEAQITWCVWALMPGDNGSFRQTAKGLGWSRIAGELSKADVEFLDTHLFPIFRARSMPDQPRPTASGSTDRST